MYKRFLCALLALLLLAMAFPISAGAAAEYAAKREGEAYAKSDIVFRVVTPESVKKLSATLTGGAKLKSARREKTENGAKTWTCVLTTDAVQSFTVTFRATLQNGKTKTFGKTKVSPKLKAPEALAPALTDNGMATLLGKFSAPKGVKVLEKYFQYREKGQKDWKKIRINNKKSLGRENEAIRGLKPGKKYEYRMGVRTNKGTLHSAKKTFTALKKTAWTARSPVARTNQEKYEYLFGKGSPEYTYTMGNPPAGYANANEAGWHITKITVPVWKRNAKGKKYSSTWTFQINTKLAANVKAIFQEIYELPEKFPFQDITTYKYRTIGGKGIPESQSLSKHAFGCAIDINRRVNDLYIGADRRDKSSPYYITKNVVNIFKKHGWTWDGDKDKYVDTMHFQYLGDAEKKEKAK